MTTQAIIEKVLKQLANGQVEIDSLDNFSWTFITKLYSNIEGSFSGDYDAPVLQIPNFELFVEKVDNYLKIAQKFYKRDQEYFDLDDNAFKEKLFFNLLTNASYYDFENIYNFIDEKTEMLQHPFPSGVFTRILFSFEPGPVFYSSLDYTNYMPTVDLLMVIMKKADKYM